MLLILGVESFFGRVCIVELSLQPSLSFDSGFFGFSTQCLGFRDSLLLLLDFAGQLVELGLGFCVFIES